MAKPAYSKGEGSAMDCNFLQSMTSTQLSGEWACNAVAASREAVASCSKGAGYVKGLSSPARLSPKDLAQGLSLIESKSSSESMKMTVSCRQQSESMHHENIRVKEHCL